MYEINLSTLMLIGINEFSTKVVEIDKEFIVESSARDIMNNSCKFFGSSLNERVNTTKRLVNISSKAPILVEESRSIIFFPLRSTREKNNIWVSFNNLVSFESKNKSTMFVFKENKEYSLDFSYYIIDNQVTRSMMLDYILKKRKETLKK